MQATLQCGYDDPFIEPRLLHSYPAKAYIKEWAGKRQRGVGINTVDNCVFVSYNLLCDSDTNEG